MTHSTARSPPVRRATQEAARASPAAVAGNWPSSRISPWGQARIEMAWLRAWVSTPMTNGCECATMAMGDRRSFLETEMDTVAKRPVPVCLLYTSDAADEEDSVDLGG